MNLKPMRNRIIVKPIKLEQKTASGIILPNDSKEPSTTGHVVAAGIDELGDILNVGDQVIFTKYSGTQVKIKDEDYIIMK